jgi:sulfur carrier protein
LVFVFLGVLCELGGIKIFNWENGLKLFVNGELKEMTEGTTLAGLIRSLDIRPETVVSEVNLKIIQAPERPGTQLSEGDRIELIQFVGGG